MTLDSVRAAYIRLLSSLGSNAEVKAEVTLREQVDQMQLQMLDPKPRKRMSKSASPIVRVNLSPLGK